MPDDGGPDRGRGTDAGRVCAIWRHLCDHTDNQSYGDDHQQYNQHDRRRELGGIQRAPESEACIGRVPPGAAPGDCRCRRSREPDHHDQGADHGECRPHGKQSEGTADGRNRRDGHGQYPASQRQEMHRSGSGESAGDCG